MRTPTGAILFAALCAAAFPTTRCELEDYIPSGTHLSLGVGDDEMTVTWRTAAPTGSVVEYGPYDPHASADPAANLPESQSGESSEFEDGGKARTRRVMHAVTLTGLEPGAKYSYRVGDPTRDAWSQVFWFTAKRTPRQIAEGPPLKILAVCDIGHEESAELLSFVRSEVHDPRTHGGRVPDFLIHCGDFAYDLHGDDGAVGDAFMEDIQPIAAYLPYMTSAGNHESAYNFSHYTNRFNMPGEDAKRTGNHYYSFDAGPAHVVAWNTEAFFFPEFFDEAYVARMYEWLEKDLAAANANRENVPWIVAYSHRPMYCPTTEKTTTQTRRGEARSEIGVLRGRLPRAIRAFAAQLTGHTGEPAEEPAEEPVETVGGSRRQLCDWEHEATRLGYRSQCDAAYGLSCSRAATTTTVEGVEGVESVVVGTPKNYPVEELYHRYGVDLALTGHKHNYERFYPAYDEVADARAGAFFERYESPAATVHVVTGAGGNPSMNDKGKKPRRGRCDEEGGAPWCAYVAGVDNHDRLSDFTYSRVTMHNATTLEWEQMSALEGGEVIDRFYIVAPTHGSFAREGLAVQK